jgi:transcriptional regulator with XRE-family HTH domain
MPRRPDSIGGVDRSQKPDEKTAKHVLAMRLKTLMRERGVNRQKVASKTGVAARTIGYMTEPSKSNPRLENLIAVAGYFGLQVWELFFDPEVDTPKLMERGLKGRVYVDVAREEPKNRQQR